MVLEYQNYTARFLLWFSSVPTKLCNRWKGNFSRNCDCAMVVVVYFHGCMHIYKYISYLYTCQSTVYPSLHILVSIRSRKNKCRITYASIKTKRKRTENFPIHFARFMLTSVKTFRYPRLADVCVCRSCSSSLARSLARFNFFRSNKYFDVDFSSQNPVKWIR